MQSDISTSMDLEKKIADVIFYAQSKSIILDRETALYLTKHDFKKVLSYADKENLSFINVKNVDSILESIEKENFKVEKEKKIEDLDVIVKEKKYRRIAEEHDANFKILEHKDVTNKQTGRGKVDDFKDYVKERYDILSKLIKKHSDFSPTESKGIKYHNKGDEVDIIGMVYEKRETKNKHLLVSLDDKNGFFNVLFDKNKDIFQEARRLLEDDLIGIKGIKLDKNFIYADEIVFPDLPVSLPKRSEVDLDLLSTSDMHIGSNMFYKKEFGKFIEWIKNGKGSEKVKYLTIVGDAVDGVGVYPNQDKELLIKDIYKQYEILADYLSQIPEYIEVFITPGNHDAVRRADPQPAIPKEYVKSLDKIKNIHLLGSPTMIEIEGLKTLLYHGNSMNDMQGKLKLDFTKPIPSMEAYLKRRDLCPMYGGKNPISPDIGGFLQITEEPDIFITGHLHSNGYGVYKKTVLINPGTWQAQTSFQKQQGHVPTPGRVPILNLKTGKIKEKVFIDESTKE